MALGDKRAALMRTDRGANGGVAAIDSTGRVVGAFNTGGDIGPGDGGDLAALANRNGWYLLKDGETYLNTPAGYSGWGVLWVVDKTATLIQVGGNIYYSSNLTAGNWAKMYTDANLVELRDALKAIWEE